MLQVRVEDVLEDKYLLTFGFQTRILGVLHSVGASRGNSGFVYLSTTRTHLPPTTTLLKLSLLEHRIIAYLLYDISTKLKRE